MVECWPSICRHFHANGIESYWTTIEREKWGSIDHVIQEASVVCAGGPVVERESFFFLSSMLDISIFHSFSWPLEWVLIMSNAPIEDCYRVAAPSWVRVWCERVPRAGTVRQHLCCFLKPNWKVAELLLSPSEEQNSIQLLLHTQQQQLLRVVDWRQKLWWWW
jgi:hypothetical protein